MTEEKQPTPLRSYTLEIKQQYVDLSHSGKRECCIVRKYDIAKLLLDRWIGKADNSGFFKEKDNRTPE